MNCGSDPPPRGKLRVLIYLAVALEQLPQALRFTERIAHAAYRIGPDGRLVRRNLLPRTRGGLLVLEDWKSGPVLDAAALCRDVWRECGNRGYGGVVADFEGEPAEDKAAFLEALGAVLSRNRMKFFVPEAYGHRISQAGVLICTAISGGVLRQRLEAAAGQFGASRVALDLQRLRMSFPLPCPEGEGAPMSAEALETLLRERRPSIFYSGDLCAKYFTCTRDGESRFVMFDDADTLRRKIQLGQELGLGAGFLMYPETVDLLPALFGKKER